LARVERRAGPAKSAFRAQRADQQRILDAVSGSMLVSYEGAGHALHWEQPALFAADVERFAKRSV
jgi:pimeloyl-ACP methyl ester carboxylesterase